jgi:drug/metabolite transporter (DMT)-like permease
MKPASRSSRITTQILILLNAAIWAGYTVYTLLNRNTSGTGLSAATWIMSALALASALALVVVVLLLRQHRRSGYYLGLILLTLIAILSITDQIGLLDILSLLISLAPLILLVRDRKWYLKKE